MNQCYVHVAFCEKNLIKNEWKLLLCKEKEKGMFLQRLGGLLSSIMWVLALSFVYHVLFRVTLFYLNNQRQQVMR